MIGCASGSDCPGWGFLRIDAVLGDGLGHERGLRPCPPRPGSSAPPPRSSAGRPRRSRAGACGSPSGRNRRCRARDSGAARRAGSGRQTGACSRSQPRPAPRALRGRSRRRTSARAPSDAAGSSARPPSPRGRSSVKLGQLHTSAATPKSCASRSAAGDHLTQNRAAAEELHPRRLLGALPLPGTGTCP